MNISTAIDIGSTQTGKTRMGCFIICEDIVAVVGLQETAAGSGQFQLVIQYEGSGVVARSGTLTVPVSGDVPPTRTPSMNGFYVTYAVSDWNLSSTACTLRVSASASYDGAIKLGPDPVFTDAPLGGTLPSVQQARDAQRLARLVAMDDAMHAATGVGCSALGRR